MKIVFLSNYINHHQIGFSKELNILVGENNFHFVQEEPLPIEKIKLGYLNDYQKEPFIVEYNGNNDEEILRLVDEADVIINSFSQGLKFLKRAMKKKKIIFWYSERLYKDYNKIKSFIKYLRAKYYFDFYHNSNQYQLFASYYGYKDIKKTSKRFLNKSFAFGYFPITNSTSIYQKNISINKLKFLFIARLIDWKHPEIIFNVADYLKEKNISFQIDVIGEGYMKEEIVNKINEKYKEDINFIGSVNFADTHKYFINNDIFLFSSDRREGWGATLGEAMSYGAIPIANIEAGSSLELINDNKNGFIYKDNNIYEALDRLIDSINNNRINEMSLLASKRVVNEWNYNLAANRFYTVLKSILDNKDINIYKEGVMRLYEEKDIID